MSRVECWKIAFLNPVAFFFFSVYSVTSYNVCKGSAFLPMPMPLPFIRSNVVTNVQFLKLRIQKLYCIEDITMPARDCPKLCEHFRSFAEIFSGRYPKISEYSEY